MAVLAMSESWDAKERFAFACPVAAPEVVP